jgi:hypothetical protein
MPRRAATSKYGAKPIVIDNIRFASQKEGRRYQELKLLEKAGELHALTLQPGFPLVVPARGNGGPYERAKVGDYRADFFYCECRRGAKCERTQVVVEDVKGFKTPLYRLKKKMVEATYGIQIREV